MIIEEILSKIESSFGDLEFEESRHLYKVKNKILTSTSDMIKKHIIPFDEIKSAAGVAKQKGIKTNEVLSEWKEIRETAANNGTRVHLFGENYVVDNQLKPKCKQEIALKKFIDDYISTGRYSLIIPEIRMYSFKYGYAGTSDILLWDNELESVIIADYKTNKDLDKQYGYLLYPFHYVPNTPYSKYQLQLSYYQILLEDIGIYPKQRIVIWLKKDGTYELRKCADFTLLLRDYLNSEINDY